MEAQPVRIGKRLEQRLAELGHNAAWLADKVGVPRSTISRIISGDRNPTAETLQEIAPVLGLSLAQLVVDTDAAGRVKEAQELVSRRDFEEAIRQVLKYEQQSNDLSARIRDLESELAQEVSRRHRATKEAEQCRTELEQAVHDVGRSRREALHNERDARRYREALEKAVADVARLNTQLTELGAAVDVGRRNGRVAAILAGVAAVVSIANYLRSEDESPLSNNEDT